MRTSRRHSVLARSLHELAGDRGLRLSAIGHDSAWRLEGAGQVHHLVGARFGLNDAARTRIADDKAATSALLCAHGLACVEHRVLKAAAAGTNGSEATSWDEFEAFARSHRYDVVCKPNRGGGGRGVERVRSPAELRQSVSRISARGDAVAVCPYLEIEAEYRLILLDGHCELSYSKERPTIVGDGRMTVAELVAERVRTRAITPRVARAVIEDPAVQGYLPAAGEAVTIVWKHNLSRGAIPRAIEDERRLTALAEFAHRAMSVLKLRFAAVDIVSRNGSLAVLEVNTAIVMELYGSLSEANYRRAKRVYGRALDSLLAQEHDRVRASLDVEAVW